MYAKNNVLVLSYNGVGASRLVGISDAPAFKMGWNYYKNGNNFYMADDQPETSSLASLIDSLDKQIHHAVIYAGSLRKLSWVKFARNSLLSKFPGCTFTIFTCCCANEHKANQAAKELNLERWQFQECDHIFGREVGALMYMYWSYGIEVFSFPTLEKFYEDYKAKSL